MLLYIIANGLLKYKKTYEKYRLLQYVKIYSSGILLEHELVKLETVIAFGHRYI